METNFGSAVDLTRAVLPQMLERRSGMIVCVSSVAGLMGAPWRTAYSASKHALTGFFGSLRTELAGNGVQVSIVYPGFVHTAISETRSPETERATGSSTPCNAQDKSRPKPRTSYGTGSRQARSTFESRSTSRLISAFFLSRHFPKLFVRSISRHGGL